MSMRELKYVNDQLQYGYKEDQLWEIMHAVGGYNSNTINAEKYSKYIARKVERRNITREKGMKETLWEKVWSSTEINKLLSFKTQDLFFI